MRLLRFYYFLFLFRVIIFFSVHMLQAAQGAVRLEGDVITSHGSVSSLPTGSAMALGLSGRGRGSSSPADNASVCTCTCTRSRSRNDGYRSGDSPPYASGSVYGGVVTGRGIGSSGDRGDGDDGCSGDDDDDEDDDGCEPQDIQLDTFYDGRAGTSTSADPYSCRQRVVQTQQQHQQQQQLQNEHRSSI